MNTYFRHNEEGEPEEVCMLDWALTRWSSPASDLVYLLFLSTAPDVRKDNLADFLEYYHRCLSSNLKEFNIDPAVYSMR